MILAFILLGVFFVLFSVAMLAPLIEERKNDVDDPGKRD